MAQTEKFKKPRLNCGFSKSDAESRRFPGVTQDIGRVQSKILGPSYAKTNHELLHSPKCPLKKKSLEKRKLRLPVTALTRHVHASRRHKSGKSISVHKRSGQAGEGVTPCPALLERGVKERLKNRTRAWSDGVARARRLTRK